MRHSKFKFSNAVLAVALFGGLVLPAQLVASSATAATPVQLSLNVLLIGNGTSDPTTVAWQSALSSEGVAYTLATVADHVRL